MAEHEADAGETSAILAEIEQKHSAAFGSEWNAAHANLERLAIALVESPLRDSALAETARRAAYSAVPTVVVNNVQRYFDAAGGFTGRAAELLFAPAPSATKVSAADAAFAVFGTSQFLSEALIRHPENLEWLADPRLLLGSRTPADFRREASAIVDNQRSREERRNALCRFRRREMLRIGARDILKISSVEEITREISDLAQAIISAGSHVAREAAVARYGHPIPEIQEESSPRILSASGGADKLPTEAGLCVIGMGKLGGRELNFSSDIDLIFIYDQEGETTGVESDLASSGRRGVVSNHAFFTYMGQELVRFLSESGPEGILYRVDMRLRPEGIDGPLARSLESFIAYLAEQARDWERLAYLKARVLAGPAQLAERLYRVINEFVFADVEPARLVGEIRALKLRIDREVAVGDAYRRDVKRGFGGIREIEFVVAAMQIVYGRAHRAIHVRNFFVAVQRLREVGLLAPEEQHFYEDAYNFLRTVEHRLQMAEEHQTHTIPPAGAALELFARRLGYANAAAFQSEYATIAAAVHERFVRFFEQGPGDVDRQQRDLLLVLDRDAPEEEARAALARMGLSAPDSLRLLRDLALGTREVFVAAAGQRHFEQMLPSLLRLTVRAPRPERVLIHLHRFMHAIKGMTYYYEVIAQHPDVLKLLVTLFGTSEALSEYLVTRPEHFDAILSTHALQERATPSPEAARQASARASSTRLNFVLSIRSPARRLVALRRAVQFETLLGGLRYLLELRSLPAVLRDLSNGADDAVNIAMRIAAERVPGQQATKAAADDVFTQAQRCFALVALGKYGGNELNFFGDLDVVFVFDDTCAAENLPAIEGYSNPLQLFTALADGLIAALAESLEGGRAYQVDARLRPHGGGSPVVTPLSGYLRYMKEEAQVWELQSWTRARTAWGADRLKFAIDEAAKARRGRISPAEIAKEVASMRERLEESVRLKPPRPGTTAPRLGGTAAAIEFKRAPGGIVDAEFLLQASELLGRLPAPVAAVSSYFEQLDALAAAPSDAQTKKHLKSVREAYAFLRNVESVVRLVTGEGAARLPADPALQLAIARQLNYPDAESLQRALRTTMLEMRGAYSALMNSPAVLV